MSDSYSKQHPFHASIEQRELLSHPSSTKKTYHISLNIKDSHLCYQEGDAVGIFPSNDPILVDRIISAIGFSKGDKVKHPRTQEEMDLYTFLLKKANLSRVTPALFSLSKKETTHSYLSFLDQEDKKEEKLALCSSHDVVTFLEAYGSQSFDSQDFCISLSPLLPRFYSIASSQGKNPAIIDLLVATFTYTVQQEMRSGIGSEFLCSHAHLHQKEVPLYIHHNPNFKLPDDHSIPIIMLGAGTGVAPYRAFLQKRILSDSTKNWLFFGERNSAYDFYYEKEFKEYEKKGFLILSTAFSRDQTEKVYIQDRLFSHRAKVWKWITEGAYLYICGDAKNMSKDVLKVLEESIKLEGGFSDEVAKEFLLDLRKTKRLQLDVY